MRGVAMKAARLLGIALVASAPLFAQFSERIDVIAVEIPISVRDRAGKVPADLTKADFEVLEDGVRQEVIGLSYPVATIAKPQPGIAPIVTPQPQQPTATQQPWQIVIFVQQSTSTTGGLRLAMKSLAAQAEKLASMGDVEIVSDDLAPHVLLAPTHDSAVLGKALGDLAHSVVGRDEITQLRQNYERERLGNNPLQPPAAVNRAVFAANIEAGLVRRRQDAMLAWMARYAAGGSAGSRLLMFVSDGYSLNPINFYWTTITVPSEVPGEYKAQGDESSADLSDLRALNGERHQSEIARTLAAQGWTVYSVAPAAIAQTGGSASLMEANYMSVHPAGTPANAPLPIAENLAPMRMLDAETGGRLTTDMSRLGSDLDSFTQRLTLTYQVRRRRDGKLHALEVRALRPGLTVESQHSVMSGSPESVATARATALALNFGQRGELPVTCVIRPTKTAGEETLEVAVDLAPLAGARGGMKASSLRVAVGVAPDKRLPFSEVQNFSNVDLSGRAVWDISIPVQKRGGAPAAVVAEEIATGAWGGGPCEVGTVRVADEAHLPAKWLPLEDALTVARTNQSMVLLYQRAGNGNNKRADEWIAKSAEYSPIAYQLDKMVLAYKTGDARVPRLLLLDYGGGQIAELPSGFGEYTALALALADIAGQAPTFAAAAELRLQGHVADSLIKRGYALLNAGVGDAAFDAFAQAAAAAEKESNREAAQYAAIGLARMKMRNRSRLLSAIAEVTQVAESAVSPGVAASAWLLVGQARIAIKDPKAAAKAYAEAYKNAPRPSAIADAARRGLEATGAPTPEEIASAAGGEMRLVYPRRPVQVGTLDVLAAAPATTARVEFFLDEQRVAQSDRAPFRARVPLGNEPRQHTLRAVAFDEKGQRVAADSAVLNSGAESLLVAIVAPRENEVESKTTVEIEPRASQGAVITGVDVFWNEQKIAALTAPPYRYELTLPQTRAFGYVRVVAHDSSGASAEDAKLINATGMAEEIRVDAVELYAVTNQRGLTAADFVVKEDGQPVEVDVRGTPDDPVTVGLVLDASTSMRPMMMDVLQYANEFITRALKPGDQVFVVAFDALPHVVQPLTSDRQTARAAMMDVAAGGDTAVWDAAAFSLGKLRGVPGKRALLLFTDGDDNGSRTTAAGVIIAAREAGVPVYVFEMERPKMKESGAEDTRLQEIADSTGGALFATPRRSDLPKLFDQVRDDTRGEYILSYVSKSTKPRTELRRVSVALRRGGTVRATSGYYPR
jgi:VWFA-related protein